MVTAGKRFASWTTGVDSMRLKNTVNKSRVGFSFFHQLRFGLTGKTRHLLWSHCVRHSRHYYRKQAYHGEITAPTKNGFEKMETIDDPRQMHDHQSNSKILALKYSATQRRVWRQCESAASSSAYRGPKRQPGKGMRGSVAEKTKCTPPEGVAIPSSPPSLPPPSHVCAVEPL